VNLRRAEGHRPLVVGHRGARGDAPENSAAALEAAVAARADVVEFDVSPGLVIAHSPAEQAPDALTLDDALELLGAHAIGLHVDVKDQGYEADVVAAVRRHGVGERTYFSSAWPASVRRLADAAPEIPRAIGYPRDRYDLSRLPWPAPLTAAGAGAARALMPARIPLLLRQSRATALSLHHSFCSRAAVAAAHRLGAPVVVWTVNEPGDVIRFARLGVDGIVSDDPETTLATLSAP
jgi:glycerophosphoryl diester phosphodiesterase